MKERFNKETRQRYIIKPFLLPAAVLIILVIDECLFRMIPFELGGATVMFSVRNTSKHV